MRSRSIGLVAMIGALSGCAVGDTAAKTSGSLEGSHGRVDFEVRPVGAVREGTNGFRLTLADTSTGAPILGAALSTRVTMPAMGHETAQVDASEVGDGVYELPDVIFDMPGAWSLRLRTQKDAVVDEAEYPVEVP